MARRQHLTVLVAIAIIVFLTISFLLSGGPTVARDAAAEARSQLPLQHSNAAVAPPNTEADGSKAGFSIDIEEIPSLDEGESIAPKLENATLKFVPATALPCHGPPTDSLRRFRAELGRATWKFLHTMVARFPEKPTESERQTLESFFQLFGRLYPCGDCARHFRGILKKYPPQTGSRNSAAGWLCFAHNQVNKRLQKPDFDCNKIGDFYDCGCGDDDKKGGAEGKDTQSSSKRHES